MKGSVPTIIMVIALVIIAVMIVPAGTFSVTTKPNGSIREEVPKAVTASEAQQ